MKHMGKRVSKITSVFIQLFDKSTDYSEALRQIQNFLSPSSSKAIVNRVTNNAEAVNSAKKSHLFFIGTWNVLCESIYDSVDINATVILQNAGHIMCILSNLKMKMCHSFSSASIKRVSQYVQESSLYTQLEESAGLVMKNSDFSMSPDWYHWCEMLPGSLPQFPL